MNSTMSEYLDDESIVVLGSSIPKSINSSLLQRNNTDSDDISDIQDYVKLDYNGDSNSHHIQTQENSLKNYVKIDGEPSMSSMMIASNIVSSCSTAEVQIKLANILDENNILRETLKENNTSIKEQFKTIVSWRDDVMKTYVLHKDKFAETKELIEKLKGENIQQKNELDIMKAFMVSQYGNSNIHKNTSSYEQLVDDSKVDMLTDRLEVIEKEKRKILHENEELHWQKDSLQTIIDNNLSQIEELRIKLDNAESNELQLKNQIKSLEIKITNIQDELKSAQYKLSASENFKLEHSQYKQTTQNAIRHLKIEIQELKTKLKDAYVLTLQPLRFSMELEEDHNSEHYETFSKNILIYDKVLKDLSTVLNLYSDSFSTLLENVSLLIDSNILESNNEAKTTLNTIKNLIDTHHKSLTQHNQKIKSLLSGFEKIFSDYQDTLKLLKTNKVKLNECVAEKFKQNDDLVDMNNELTNLRKLISTLQKDSDQLDLLKAQIEVYRSDFEVERKARTDIAAEKQSLVEQLRVLHASKQKLVEDFDGYRQSHGGSSHMFHTQEQSTPAFTEVYSCPICQECFDSTNTLQEHANSCIDKNG